MRSIRKEKGIVPPRSIQKLRADLRAAKDTIERQSRHIKRLKSQIRRLNEQGDVGGWERENLRSRIPDRDEWGQ